MDTDRWQELRDAHERLRWARLRWQEQNNAVGTTAKAAAESMGMKEGTYRAYEREPGSSKSTPLDHQKAIQFGRKFKVSWRWLLLGTGTPSDEAIGAEQERVLEAMAQLDPDRQRMIAEMVEGMLLTGTR